MGFRIDNRTDLESGTHIAGIFPGVDYGGSVEDLIYQGRIRGDEPLFEVMNTSFGGKKVVSILSARTREKTGTTNALARAHELGGGNLSQTFVWKEKRHECGSALWFALLPLTRSDPPGMNVWKDYSDFTIDPPETAP